MVHLEVCFPPHPLAPDNPTASATSLVTLLKILQTARAVVFSPIAWGPALYGLHFFGTFISFIPPHISSSWEPKEAYNIVLPSSILSSQAPYEICNLGWVCMTGLLLPKEASMVERGIWTWDSQPLIWYPDHRSIRACYLWANREALGPWSLAFLQRNKVKLLSIDSFTVLVLECIHYSLPLLLLSFCFLVYRQAMMLVISQAPLCASC